MEQTRPSEFLASQEKPSEILFAFSSSKMPILQSKFSDVEIPEDVSIVDLVFQGVDAHKDRPAIVSSMQCAHAACIQKHDSRGTCKHHCPRLLCKGKSESVNNREYILLILDPSCHSMFMNMCALVCCSLFFIPAIGFGSNSSWKFSGKRSRCFLPHAQPAGATVDRESVTLFTMVTN